MYCNYILFVKFIIKNKFTKYHNATVVIIMYNFIQLNNSDAYHKLQFAVLTIIH